MQNFTKLVLYLKPLCLIILWKSLDNEHRLHTWFFCSLFVSRDEYWPCQATELLDNKLIVNLFLTNLLIIIPWKTSCCCRCFPVTSHAMGSSQGVIQNILILFTCHRYVAVVNIESLCNIHLSCYSFFLEEFFFLIKGMSSFMPPLCKMLPMGLWERESSRAEIVWQGEQISLLKETGIIAPGKYFSEVFLPCWKQTTVIECLLPLDVSAGQKKGRISEIIQLGVLGYGYHSSSQNNAPGVHLATGMNNNWHSWECFIEQLHTQMCGDPNFWSTLP